MRFFIYIFILSDHWKKTFRQKNVLCRWYSFSYDTFLLKICLMFFYGKTDILLYDSYIIIVELG